MSAKKYTSLFSRQMEAVVNMVSSFAADIFLKDKNACKVVGPFT